MNKELSELKKQIICKKNKFIMELACISQKQAHVRFQYEGMIAGLAWVLEIIDEVEKQEQGND